MNPLAMNRSDSTVHPRYHLKMHSKASFQKVKCNQCPVEDFNIANMKIEKVENKDFKGVFGLCLANRRSFDASPQSLAESLCIFLVTLPSMPFSTQSGAFSIGSVTITASPVDSQSMHETLRRIHRHKVAQVWRQIPVKRLTIPPQRCIIRARWIRLPHIHGKTQTWSRLVRNVRGRQTPRRRQVGRGAIRLVGDTLVKAKAGDGCLREGDVSVGVVEEEMFLDVIERDLELWGIEKRSPNDVVRETCG